MNNLKVQQYGKKQIIVFKFVRYNIMQSLKLNLQGIYDNMGKYSRNKQEVEVGGERPCKNFYLQYESNFLKRTYFYMYTEKGMPMNVPMF